MIVLWPPSAESALFENIDLKVRLALQCALDIQAHLENFSFSDGSELAIKLRVKVGLGVGPSDQTLSHSDNEILMEVPHLCFVNLLGAAW